MLPRPHGPGSLNDWVRRVGFWLAVGIPSLYLPVLIAGPNLPGAPTILAGLLAINLLGLLVGHGYRAGDDNPVTRGPTNPST